MLITRIRNFIDANPTSADNKIPVTWDAAGTAYIWAKASLLAPLGQKMD